MAVQVNNDMQQSHLDLLQNSPFRIEDVLSLPVANDFVGHQFKPLWSSKYICLSHIEMPGQSESLTVAHRNCHLNSNHHEVACLLDLYKNKVEVLRICESFVTQDTFILSHFLPGYKLVLKSRSSMRGGGLTFLLANSFNYVIQDDLTLWNEDKLETLSIEIELEKNRKFIISLVYWLPSTNPDEFFGEFNGFLQRMSSTKLQRIFLGDLNLDLLNLGGVNLDFFNLMLSHNLYPAVSIPTRITDHLATLIDNIFLSLDAIVECCADVVLHPGSDHLPVFCNIKRFGYKHKTTTKLQFRMMKAENLRKFKEEISTVSWQRKKTPRLLLINLLSPIYDQCCPLKTATKKKNQPQKPWIMEEIPEMMKKRDQLFSDYLNCESDDSWEEYRKARNRVNSAQ